MCPRSYTGATYWRMKRIQCLLGVNWPCCGIMLLVQGQALNSCEVAKAPPIQLGLKSIQLATFEHSLRSRQIGFKTPWEALVLFLVRFQPVLKSLLQTSPSKPFNTLKNSLPTMQHISAVKLPGLCWCCSCVCRVPCSLPHEIGPKMSEEGVSGWKRLKLGIKGGRSLNGSHGRCRDPWFVSRGDWIFRVTDGSGPPTLVWTFNRRAASIYLFQIVKCICLKLKNAFVSNSKMHLFQIAKCICLIAKRICLKL